MYETVQFNNISLKTSTFISYDNSSQYEIHVIDMNSHDKNYQLNIDGALS